MVVRNTARLTLIQCIDKLIDAGLLPSPNDLDFASPYLVTHVPTNVMIDTDINGYYLIAPSNYGRKHILHTPTPFFDYTSGDFIHSTTDPKVMALGWLLCVIEYSAVQALNP